MPRTKWHGKPDKDEGHWSRDLGERKTSDNMQDKLDLGFGGHGRFKSNIAGLPLSVETAALKSQALHPILRRSAYTAVCQRHSVYAPVSPSWCSNLANLFVVSEDVQVVTCQATLRLIFSKDCT